MKCFWRKDLHDPLFPKVRGLRPNLRAPLLEAHRSSSPKRLSRETSPRSPKLPVDGTPQTSPQGPPFRGSVYGVVTPSSRGSPPGARHGDVSFPSVLPDGIPNAPSREGSQSPRGMGEASRKAPPPGTGGDRPPLRFNTRPTSEENAEPNARDAYYRQSLLQIGHPNADRIRHQRTKGSLRDAPSARCVPLAEVLGADVSRSSTYTGGPTPNAVAKRREAERKHGHRAYDSFDASMLWKRLDTERPLPQNVRGTPRMDLAKTQSNSLSVVG